MEDLIGRALGEIGRTLRERVVLRRGPEAQRILKILKEKFFTIHQEEIIWRGFLKWQKVRVLRVLRKRFLKKVV